MLFSATYENDVMDFALTIINDANVIKLERKEENLENIKQVYVRCRNSTEKYDAIAKIYGAITIGGAMIFCRVRHKIKSLRRYTSKVVLITNVYRLRRLHTGWLGS